MGRHLHRFLSTPSVRRATLDDTDSEDAQDISIHALREEGDLYFMVLYYNHDDISIHALREEGDCMIQ